MKGRIHHLMLNVNRYHEAERFYAWRLPKIGYPNQTKYAEDTAKRGSGWYNDAGSVWVQEAEPRFRSGKFHRHRVGRCEIAFAADSRVQVDELATEIERHGGRVTEAPRQYDYVPGYYAVFFTTRMASSWRWCTCHEHRLRTAAVHEGQSSRSSERPWKILAEAGSFGHQAAPRIEIAKNRHDRLRCSFI